MTCCDTVGRGCRKPFREDGSAAALDDGEGKAAVERDKAILRYLATHDGWTTSAVLAEEMGCSVRTIKSDISKLNAAHPGLVRAGRRGFSLGDRTLFSQIDPIGTNPVPQTAEERRSAILRTLLMGHRRMTPEELADELCVSAVTLSKDLARIRLDMSEYGLEVHSRSGVLHVTGGEESEKRMVSSLVFNETKGFVNQVDAVGGYFPDLDLATLRDGVEETLVRHRFFLNDYALANFVLHLAIVIERARNGLTGEDGGQAADVELDREVVRLVDDVCDQLEARYGVAILGHDRASFGVILTTRLETRQSSSAEFVGQESLALVREIVARVQDEYTIELGGESFLIRFGLHLKNMLVRLRANKELRNPQTASIRNDYPFVYDIAVFIAQQIGAAYGLAVPDDEIAYVALHIGCLIEEQNVERTKLRCVLVSPRYNDNGIQLAWRILRSHEESLIIDGVVDSVERLPHDYHPDLVIASGPLTQALPYPVVEISPFLGERDLATLRAQLEMLRSSRRRREMEARLRKLFSRELFFCHTGFADEQDAIEAMGDALIAAGCARADYKERLREREAISSSAYLDVALPHPLDMDALRTAIAVSVHPEGLSWAGTTVHLVLMLAIHPKDKPVFRSIFDFVTDALYDQRHMSAVVAAESFEEFLDALLG